MSEARSLQGSDHMLDMRDRRGKHARGEQVGKRRPSTTLSAP
jgi:hypothetical protein